MNERAFSMSVKDFKEIIDSLKFTKVNDLVLCINCKSTDIYFKFIMEESNVSTYYLNETVMVDSEDILLMFDYKLLSDVIDKTENGTIQFKLNGKNIHVVITNSIKITLNFMNNVDDQMLGEIEVPKKHFKIDSNVLKNMLKYFVRPSKNLSKYFMTNYLFLSVSNNILKLELNDLIVTKTIISDDIEKCKLHIDCLHNFINSKNYILDIYISTNFPLVCKSDTNFGLIELVSAPIFD